ncbi:MAG: Hsp20/alpha crystallin family protein [Verrucomicrobium sp.]|nr:Hsp20/alpha crystallin family protein [Verrucomicrobium sp.]
MKLTRYNQIPFAGFPSLSRLFDWEPTFGAVSGRLATDIHEDKDNYFATFEVPGVKKEDVKVELNERLLTVTVQRKQKNGETESSFTSTRSVSVPDSVKSESISAKVEDGLLTVTLPKAEERKPRNIEIS